MKLKGVPLTTMLLLLLAAPVCLSQTVYEVEGTVYGPDGKMLANVVMRLQNDAGVQIDQDITNSDGRYCFAGVIAGTYYLSAKPPDRTTQTVVQKMELVN